MKSETQSALKEHYINIIRALDNEIQKKAYLYVSVDFFLFVIASTIPVLQWFVNGVED